MARGREGDAGVFGEGRGSGGTQLSLKSGQSKNEGQKQLTSENGLVLPFPVFLVKVNLSQMGWELSKM